MARGANQHSQPYIPLADRQLPEAEQTRFWIRVKNSAVADEISRRYAKARKDGPGGDVDFDLLGMQKARQAEWLQICDKVENYGWSESYLEDHPQVAQGCNEQGYYLQPITQETTTLFVDVLGDLPSDLRVELFDVADSRQKLEAGHPKNVNLPSD